MEKQYFDAVTQWARELWQQEHKETASVPTVVPAERGYEGTIINRMFRFISGEAMDILDDGEASDDDEYTTTTELDDFVQYLGKDPVPFRQQAGFPTTDTSLPTFNSLQY
jgi:hypothetical protein